MKKIEKFIKKSDFKFIFFLAIICFIGFWQVGFMIHPLKWDTIDYYFPSNFFIGEMLQNKMLPLWNPYQILGYPIYADPQSGAWYPITLIIGLINGYSINIMSFEFVLHIFLAGWGMFILGKTLNYNRNIAFIIAVAYMLSGLFIGNAQHFTFIISATWLPYIISNFILLSKNKNLFISLKLAFFGYLMISGGYPAFIFVLIYILLILLIYFIIIEYRNNKIKGVINYLKYIFLSIFVLILCSTIILVSSYFLLPYLSRASAISAELALSCPFSPKCMLSFFAPLSVVVHYGSEIFNTDISMTNGYFGILLLVFTIVGFWIKKKPIQWIFLSIALLCLLLSFGSYTPLRMVLYDYVPLMNLFRFPAMFRLFFIIFFLLVAGNSLQIYFFQKQKIPYSIFIVSFVFVLFMSITILFFRANGYLDIKNFVYNELFTFSQKSTIQQHFVFHAAIQIIILVAFMFVIFKFKTTNLSLKLITVLIIAEMLISTQLTSPYTVYDQFSTNKKCQNFLQTLPSGFPIPSNNPVVNNENIAKKESPIWRNTNMFNKQISHLGFTPFIFKNYIILLDSMPKFFSTILNNQPIYLSNSIYPIDSLKNHINIDKFDSNFIYLQQSDFAIVKEIANFDSLIGSVKITKFSPNEIIAECNSTKPAFVVLLQNYYYGWKAFVNDKEMPIIKTNITTMGVIVPQGKSIIRFQYKPINIYIAYFFSIFCFLILTLLIIWLWIKSRGIKNEDN